MAIAEHAEAIFHLTGRILGEGLLPVKGRLRPACLSRYSDLSQLRHDFPMVLAEGPAPGDGAVSLADALDGAVRRLSEGKDPEQLAVHAWRLEREMRRLAAERDGWRLGDLAREAAARAQADADFADAAKSIAENLPQDGAVLTFGPGLPDRFVGHLWLGASARKARSTSRDIARLMMRLREILEVEVRHTEEGWTAERLRASVGRGFEDAFDFERLSGIAGRAAPKPALTPSRKRRIEGLLKTLAEQRFVAPEGTANGQAPYDFRFATVREALDAIRSRAPLEAEFARAVAVAELEVEGLYEEAKHDALFEGYGDHPDVAERLGMPDYLVRLNARELADEANSSIGDALAAGLPLKLLVVSDDLASEDASNLLGLRLRELSHMALGLANVFVFQAAAASLYGLRERISRGLAYPGSALFVVYTGGSGGSVDPYLAAAAAHEARVFPSFVYDPSAGDGWAARFSVDANPQADRDWPLRRVIYEEQALAIKAEEPPFTYADFALCDGRFARHFALVPREKWSDRQVPAERALADPSRASESIPFVYAVDDEDRLWRAVIDRRLMAQLEQARAAWVSLRELGGVENSHVARALAEAERHWEARLLAAESKPAASPATAPEEPAPSQASPPVGEAATETAAPAEAREPGEAFIETSRCTSCNECIQVNDKMFAYNDDKQAYIADKSAGTYRQLVEAAEGCQVAIIHPGKPWNPKEPGLEELLKRAAPFQ